MGFDFFSKDGSDKCHKIFKRCCCDACHASEMQQKSLFCLVSHSRNASQYTFYLSLASEVSVESDTEAVCLISHLLQQLKSR